MRKNKAWLMTSIIFLLLVIPIVFASKDIWHKYQYDESTRTASIKTWLGAKVVDLELLSNTDNCLIDCEAIIKVTPYVDIKNSLLDKNKADNDYNFKFYNLLKKEIKELGKELKNVNLEIQKQVFREVNDYALFCNPYWVNVTNNITGKNEEQEVNNCTNRVIGYHLSPVMIYESFDITKYDFFKDKTEIIRLSGKKSKDSKVEWIPTFFGYDIPEWAWWNSSYNYKRNLNCSGMTDGVPLMINGSNGVTLNGSTQYIWTFCQGQATALYYNDNTDYVVANDTSQIPHEGNGTSYNPTSVWSDYTLVTHFGINGTIKDSTSNNHNATLINSPTYTASGRVGGAYMLDGVNDNINFSNDAAYDFGANSNVTIQFWQKLGVKATASQWGKRGSGASVGYAVYYASTSAGYCQMGFRNTAGADCYIDKAGYWNNGFWERVNLVLNGPGNAAYFYSNTTSIANTSDVDCAADFSGGAFDLLLGQDQSATGWMNYTIDELRIAKKIFTQARFIEEHNNLLGISGYGNILAEEVLPSNIAPVITLSLPANNNWTTSNTPSFKFTATDDNNLTMICFLTINSTNYGINSSTNNNTLTTIIANTTLPDNTGYNWNINCSDGNLSGVGSARSINIDTTNPVSTALSPINNYNSSSVNISFGLKCSDNLAVNTSVLYGNWTGTWSANQTNSTPINNTAWNVSVNMSGSGYYTWSAWCNDTTGNSNFASNLSFKVDTIPPSIILSSPADLNWTNNNTPGFGFTATDNLASLLTCSLKINGSGYGTNSSTLNNTLTVITANTSLADNTGYSWSVNCSDGISNNVSANRTINIDATSPSINYTSSAFNYQENENATSYTGTWDANPPISAYDGNWNTCNYRTGGEPTITFNYTKPTSSSVNSRIRYRANSTSDANIYEANYSSYSGCWNALSDNVSIRCYNYPTPGVMHMECWNGTSWQNIFTGTAEYCCETAINWSILYTLNNNSWTNNPNQTFYFTTTDNLASNTSCSLYFDNTLNQTNSSTLNNTGTSFTINNIPSGSHSWFINCTDTASNQVTGGNMNLGVDTIPPNITLNNPPDNNWTSNITPTFTFTTTDNLNLTTSCTLYINSTAYAVNNSVINNTQTSFITNSSLAEATNYVWWINCSDQVQTTKSSTRIINIDSTPPSITINSPADNKWTNNNTPTFNFTVTDKLAINTSCYLRINSTNYGINNSVLNNTATTIISNTSLADNTDYAWNITCTDLTSNSAQSSMRRINIDTNIPSINLISPENNNVTKNNTPSFTFNMTDSLSSNANCTLIIDDTNLYGTNSSTNNNTNTILIANASITDGLHTWKINCTDQANNTGNSTKRNITIDASPPQINIISPVNNNFTINQQPTFIFNQTDTISSTASCTLYINSTSYGINTTTNNNTQTSFTANTTLTPSRYVWNITCTDESSNQNSSTNRNITTYNMTLNITSPITGDNVTRYLNITYVVVFTPNTTTATLFNISLLNNDTSFNQTIQSNNTNNLSYYWDTYTTNLSLGNYYVLVNLTDSNNNQFYNISGLFNIINNALLNISANETINNTPISTFNISLYDFNTGITQTQTSSNNKTVFNVTKGHTYNASIDATGYALNWTNITINQTFQEYTFQLYITNSISIYVFDEITGNVISDTFNVSFTSLTAYYMHSFTGNQTFISNIPADAYELRFTSVNYSEKRYSLTITNRTTQSLDAYFISNANLTNIGVYIKTVIGDPISDATVAIQRQINGSYVTITQRTTDITGYILFQLEEGTRYKWIITSTGYGTRDFLLEPYSINSPYTFKLTETATTPYIPSTFFVSYLIRPSNTTLQAQNHTFSITTSSPEGTLLWTSTSCGGTTDNVTGSPNGGTAQVTLNLSGNSGSVLACNYSFKSDGYDAYTLPYYYTIGNYSLLNNTFLTTMETARTEIISTKPGWLIIVATFIILAGALTMYQLTTSSTVSIVTSFAGLIIFAFIGWIPTYIMIITVLIGGIILYFKGGI